MFLTSEVQTTTSRHLQTNPCVSWRQWGETLQYCSVCQCDVAARHDSPGLGRQRWPGYRAPGRVINHQGDRNSSPYIRIHRHTTQQAVIHQIRQPKGHLEPFYQTCHRILKGYHEYQSIATLLQCLLQCFYAVVFCSIKDVWLATDFNNINSVAVSCS